MDQSRNPPFDAHSNLSPHHAAEVGNTSTSPIWQPESGSTHTSTSVTTGTWSADEDNRLKDAVAKHGTRWSLVATYVQTRNGEQCAKRWNDYVNPDLDHSPWSAHEDRTLLALVGLYGHNWKLMSENFLSARSTLAIKNRHSLLMRRQNREARQKVKQQQHHQLDDSTEGPDHAPGRCPFDLLAIESARKSTSSSTNSPLSAQDQPQDHASSVSLSGRSTNTVTNSALNASPPIHPNNMHSADPSVDLSHLLSLAPSSSMQYDLEAGHQTSLPSFGKSMTPQNEWQSMDAYHSFQLEDILGGPDTTSHHGEVGLGTPSSLGRGESVRSAADQDMEFSVTCSKSRLKTLVCHAFEGAMLEMEGSAEGEPVTVTLRLKK